MSDPFKDTVMRALATKGDGPLDISLAEFNDIKKAYLRSPPPTETLLWLDDNNPALLELLQSLPDFGNDTLSAYDFYLSEKTPCHSGKFMVARVLPTTIPPGDHFARRRCGRSLLSERVRRDTQPTDPRAPSPMDGLVVTRYLGLTDTRAADAIDNIAFGRRLRIR